MKTLCKFILLFFLLLCHAGAHADSVRLYDQITPELKIYSPVADLMRIYYQETEGREGSARDEFSLRNRQQIAAFEKTPFEPLGADLSLDTLEQVQKNLIEHAVAGREPVKTYDSKGGQVGFCYGRALLVQRQLERLGADRRRLFKVFLLGELSQKRILWDYHVATLYVDHRGQSWVIDSLNDRVLSLSDWYQGIHAYFLNPKQPKVLMYFAEPDKFQARAGEFSTYDMFDPLYRGYFFDLALWL